MQVLEIVLVESITLPLNLKVKEIAKEWHMDSQVAASPSQLMRALNLN